MKIVSWNVNGLRSAIKKGFESWLLESKADFVCLQEIKSGPISFSSSLFNQSNYFEYFNSAERKGYSGTAIFTKVKPITFNNSLGFEKFDFEGRFSTLIYENVTIINVYMPHGGRDKKNLEYKLESYEKLLEYLAKIKNENVVLVGDFNIAHGEADLARPRSNIRNIMFTPEERVMLGRLIDLGFDDSFRMFDKKGGNYTWWPYRNDLRKRNVGWRIDYIFVSKSLGSKLVNASILKTITGSDHCPVGIDLRA